eukprot:TRINITY_DN19257_c0_g1_i1.p1 TRINITY_DN19257_c0_g1~~TRINITY_DN19257_c0_g1_i1.p1  ORF type:complete len:612 (+),score=159.55 TRINITY_DN19257_c0_g1_i1:89-1837(+)
MLARAGGDYDTFGDQENPGAEAQGSEPRSRYRGLGKGHIAAFLMAAVALLAAAHSTEGSDFEVPEWLRELDFGAGERQNDYVRRTLARHRISPQVFWRLSSQQAATLFPDSLGTAMLVAQKASTGAPDLRVPTDDNNPWTGLVYKFQTVEEWTIFKWSVVVFCVVVFIVTYYRESHANLLVDAEEPYRTVHTAAAKKKVHKGVFQGGMTIADKFADNTGIRGMKPQANIYRMLAVARPTQVEHTGRSHLAFLVLCMLAAWMQIYLPWVILRSNINKVSMLGLKLPTWYVKHIGSVLTSLCALVTMGVIFIKSVQMSVIEETLQVYRLLSFEDDADVLQRQRLAAEKAAQVTGSPTKPEPSQIPTPTTPPVPDAVPSSPSGKAKPAPKRGAGAGKAKPLPKAVHISEEKAEQDLSRRATSTFGHATALEGEGAEQFCFCIKPEVWEGFWAITSLIICYWSATILSVVMLLSIASYDGDASNFVLNTMKIFFVMGIDEKLVDVFPVLGELFVKAVKQQDTLDRNVLWRGLQVWEFYMKVLSHMTVIMYAVTDVIFTAGLVVLLLTYWDDAQGNLVGVGANKGLP